VVEVSTTAARDGDLLIGCRRLHSIVRDVWWRKARDYRLVAAGRAWWRCERRADKRYAPIVIGKAGETPAVAGRRPPSCSSGSTCMVLDFARPQPHERVIRSHFGGWSRTRGIRVLPPDDDDLDSSPYPHFRDIRFAGRAKTADVPRRRALTRCRPPGPGTPTRRGRHDGVCVRRFQNFQWQTASSPPICRVCCAGTKRPGDAGSARWHGWGSLHGVHGEAV